MIVALVAQPKKKPPTPKVKASMEKKTDPKKPAPKAEVNKSQEIRKLAKELQAKGEPVFPVTIVEILNKKDIIIASPQVKKSGKNGLSIEDHLEAEKMAEEFGGAEKLVKAISALAELQ